jgi:hypothetical protein
MHENAVQQPVEDMDGRVVEQGTPLPVIDGDGMGAGTISNGLTPALLISTEPIGIPARGRPPGDAGDVAALLVELVPQAPDIAALPGSDVPVPVPVPPPSKVVLEPDIPGDGFPIAKQVVPLPVAPIVPVGAELSPGDASSVAPMGIPAGGTGEPGAMPSGEVAPIPGIGLPIPIWEKAAPQPKGTVAIAAIKVRIIAGCSLLRLGTRPSRSQDRSHDMYRSTWGSLVLVVIEAVTQAGRRTPTAAESPASSQ